ncbi:MAG: helix-turn-helix transcriptional regulator [Thaumarchaeota archaeon]|nr:helix-turn-helix transcriptional regulator [Nitrososphaerota archaeon]
MQVLLLGRDVEEENTRAAILKIISNEQAMMILEHSMYTPRSAYEISSACSIPLTQVYRWVRRLHRLGFVKISGDTNNAGKKYFMYKSKIRSVKVTLNAVPGPQIEIL